MTELEQKRFRRGESTGRPLGGNISPEPFPQALYGLALSRGFESQKALAIALSIRYSTVGSWYRGERTPHPQFIGEILVLLQPNDEESDSLLNPYGQLLEKKPIKQSLFRRKVGRSLFDEWVEKYCDNHSLTLIAFARLLGFENYKTIRTYPKIGLDTFSRVLQNAPKALNLSPEGTEALSEVVATTIEQQIAGGRRYSGQNNFLARKLQAEFSCRTYTPDQAAKILGITREGARYLRNKFGLPLLLTENHLNMLRNRKSAGERI